MPYLSIEVHDEQMTPIQIIDRKMRQLELLRDIANDAHPDPQVLYVMRLIVDSKPMQMAAVEPKTNGETGGLTAAVASAVAGMTGHFTVREVIAEIEKAGYQLEAKNPRSAVTTVLGKLVDRKKILLVSEGKGGRPSVYTETHKA